MQGSILMQVGSHRRACAQEWLPNCSWRTVLRLLGRRPCLQAEACCQGCLAARPSDCPRAACNAGHHATCTVICNLDC